MKTKPMMLEWQYNVLTKSVVNLEAFAVNDAWARFIIFLFGDPHSLESGQRGEN